MKTLHIAKIPRVVLSIILVTQAHSALAQGKGPKPAGRDEKPPIIIEAGKWKGKLPPLPLSNTNWPSQKIIASDKALEQWNAFQHEPFDKAGFNPLLLPFQFSSSEPGASGKEALAFSFLLSNALDWMPGNYCARHAYFVFKRSRSDIRTAGRTFDTELIKQQMERWQTTHAVGGKLIRGTNGYSGELKVFDSDGKQVLLKSYDSPMDYFDLLSAMCADTMRHAGYEPSAELVEYIKMKRCKDFQSIMDLGSAAFAEERSGEEFRLYREILERDPEFAEVRYWAANQSFWSSGNRTFDWQGSKVLKSYLVPSALFGYYPERRDAENPDSEYQSWVKQVERLVGQDSPLALDCRITSMNCRGILDTNLFERAITTACKFPNSCNLLDSLVMLLKTEHPASPADCDLLASICAAGLNSRYMFGSSSGERYMMTGLAQAADALGNHQLGLQLWGACISSATESGDETSVPLYADHAASSLRRLGLLEAAFNLQSGVLEQRYKMKTSSTKDVVNTYLPAALLGRQDILQGLPARDQSALSRGGERCLLDGYLDLLRGNPINAQAARELKRVSSWAPWAYHEATILLAQEDFVTGTNSHRREITEYLEMNPNNRDLWVLFDAYDRRESLPDSWCFYEALEWLFKKDPWVRAAVAAWKQRQPNTSGNGKDCADRVMACIGVYKEVPRWPTGADVRIEGSKAGRLPPGSVAVVVRDLVNKGENAAARDAALRYQVHAASSDHPYAKFNRGYALRAYCNHLFHIAETPVDKR
ncbi:MAG: hypothetical protein C0404_09585 [Verrucomicrobia bacterium]|nr:hypothetical protein [Verrucomicrobiota bacterium]